jgi:hypothetical protein
MKELCLGSDHADAVLGSAAVPRVAYGDSSSLMPLRQAPHRHDLASSVRVRALQIGTAKQPVRLGWVAKRSQGGARRAEDMSEATQSRVSGFTLSPKQRLRQRMRPVAEHAVLHLRGA